LPDGLVAQGAVGMAVGLALDEGEALAAEPGGLFGEGRPGQIEAVLPTDLAGSGHRAEDDAELASSLVPASLDGANPVPPRPQTAALAAVLLTEVGVEGEGRHPRGEILFGDSGTREQGRGEVLSGRSGSREGWSGRLRFFLRGGGRGGESG